MTSVTRDLAERYRLQPQARSLLASCWIHCSTKIQHAAVERELEESIMDTQALRVTYFVDDEHVPPWCDDIRAFLSAALGLRFEMQYFGEACWYATTAEHVAHTLVPYYPDLTVCLDGMLDGEEIDSRLATYRLCGDQRRVNHVQNFTLRGAGHGPDHSLREDGPGD